MTDMGAPAMRDRRRPRAEGRGARIGTLVALALLALGFASFVSLHQLASVEARVSVRMVTSGSAGAVGFDALLAATRL
jgi:hypothetical protein